MKITKNNWMTIGIVAAVGAGAYFVYSQAGKDHAQPGVTLADVANDSYVMNPLAAYTSSGGHKGFADMPMYATQVMANCNPQAIQLAEGTVSVSAIHQAPDYEDIPSQLGGARG